MGFLDELADTAIRGVVGYASSMPDVKNAASVLGLAEAQDGWVASEDFLDAYDVRIYDLSNDQYDVKIMKQHDFEGGYVLWNRTKDVYHTGVGSCVYKKVERHLKGYGNQAVYEDLEGGDDFAVTLYRLSSTEYDAIRDLERALRRAFGEYPTPIVESAKSAGVDPKEQSCLFRAKKIALGFSVVLVCYLVLRLL